MSIILFVKYPKPKNVKTRLGKTIGYNEAAELYSCFVKDIIAEVKKTNKNIFIFYDELSKELDIKDWLGDEFTYIKQDGNDLGEKMYNALELIFDKFNSKKVILIGSDIPSIKSLNLIKAFEELEVNDTVIGPGYDGGYYLIGSKKEKNSSEIFKNITWSTPLVLRRTIANLYNIKRSFSFLDKVNDIDEYSDLEFFYRENREVMKASDTVKYIKNNNLLKE